MTAEWDGRRMILHSRDLDDMEVIGTGLFSVGVPVDADPEFKTYVFAAGVTHSMGNQSIDFQLKRNYDHWMRRHSPDERFKGGTLPALLRDIRNLAGQRCSELSSLTLVAEPKMGRVIAANALIRLESTFRAAVQLVRLRFAFEAEAVVRLGFEQVGWAYAISNLMSLEAVERIEATSGTNALKKLFPGAGPVYGRLSNLAHVAFHTHGRVVTTEGEQLEIEIKATEAARESAFFLIVLLDAFLVVSDSCFSSAGIRCSSIDPASTGLIKSRPAAALMSDYTSILPPDAGLAFERWWT